MHPNTSTIMGLHYSTAGQFDAPQQADPRDCRSATEAAATVQTYLNASPSLAGTRIHCEAIDGRIVLRGYVSTYSMKHAARVLAEGVSGDRRIENRLDVIPIPPA
jgi:osmotically-inducible protein OsmY